MKRGRQVRVGRVKRLSVRGAILVLAVAGAFGSAAAQDKTPASPDGQTRYVIGKPYQFDGVWYEPAVDYGYDATGVASIYPEGRAGFSTTSGEAYDEKAIRSEERRVGKERRERRC